MAAQFILKSVVPSMNKMHWQFISALGALLLGLFSTTGAIAQDEGLRQTGWSTSCLSPRVCEMKSEILSGGLTAAHASVFNLRGRYLFQYTIPLGPDLTQGIRIRIDQEPTVETHILNCTGAGCTGTVELTSALIQDMKKGGDLHILFSNALNQDSFAITFDLGGFTVAFNDLIAG